MLAGTHTTRRAFAQATALAAAGSIAAGVAGTVAVRHWGKVPFSVPSKPWYPSVPFYIFWEPRLDPGWAMVALPVACLAVVAVLLLAGAALPRPVRLAGSACCAVLLALALAALSGGPAAWSAPFAYTGEYPGAVPLVPSLTELVGRFVQLQPRLPDFPALHPPGALGFYVLVDRVWPGLTGAAVATVAAASLGALVTAGLARDELGDEGERWAVACWVLCPTVILYSATSADAMWAPVLGAAALGAHRGLERRSWGWTLVGGALLWLASMMTFGAVLVLPFLLVRALGRWRAEPGRVALWALATTAIVLALAGLVWLATGYDPIAAVRVVRDFYNIAPGHQRTWWVWLVADPVAFGGMLGFAVLAALVASVRTVWRERAFGSFEAATFAMLLTGSAWLHTKGEVERLWQFMVPFAVVVAVRQLWRWRVSLPLVGALLAGQAVLVQTLFFTRW